MRHRAQHGRRVRGAHRGGRSDVAAAAELDEDAALERLLFPHEGKPSSNRPEPEWTRVHTELKRKHVTLMLLWQEYRQQHPDGVQYSQFCEHYARWLRHAPVTMRQEHRAGEKAFVDFSGDGLDIIDPKTGEVSRAKLFGFFAVPNG